MKIEFNINNTKTMTRDEAMKTNPNLLSTDSLLVAVSCDDKIILRTSRLEEVQEIFQNCLLDLKKIED